MPKQALIIAGLFLAVFGIALLIGLGGSDPVKTSKANPCSDEQAETKPWMLNRPDNGAADVSNTVNNEPANTSEANSPEQPTPTGNEPKYSPPPVLPPPPSTITRPHEGENPTGIRPTPTLPNLRAELERIHLDGEAAARLLGDLLR